MAIGGGKFLRQPTSIPPWTETSTRTIRESPPSFEWIFPLGNAIGLAVDAAPPPLVSLPLALRLLRRIEFPRKLGLCERLFARRLARRGTAWFRAPGGGIWKADLRVPSHRWMVYGQPQRGLVRFLRARLAGPAVIVDAGANVGQMLVPLLGALPCARYLAVEPGEEARAWLREGAARNPAWPIEVIPAALSDRAGDAALAVPREGHGCQAWIAERGDQPTRLLRLADALDARGIVRVDFWKLDVEGHELPALRGAAPLLREGRIGALYVELHRGAFSEVLSFLEALGYAPYTLDAAGRPKPFRDEGLDLTDALFLRKAPHSAASKRQGSHVRQAGG